MMTTAPRHTHTDDTFELLSAYLDDALDVVERRRADALLRDCRACAFELKELRMLHQTLRALPVPKPKRSFTLDPAQVRPRMRLFPILRFASLVSAMLLVVILGIDTLGGPSQQAETAATLQAPAAAPAPEMLRQSTTEAPLAEQEAPVAAGAAPQPTSVAALAAPAAAPPAAETAEAATPASGMPEATVESGARAAKTPAEATEAPAEAAGDDSQNVMPTEAAASIAAADAAPGTAVAPEESAAGGGAPPLTNSDPSSLDTATLEQPQTRVAFAEQPANPWRFAEIILGIVVLLLAGATWWTARQRL